jgi:hypothetical protein
LSFLGTSGGQTRRIHKVVEIDDIAEEVEVAKIERFRQGRF